MSVDTWIKIWRASFAISFFGAIQFLIGLIVAMLLYPGGSTLEPNSPGFDLAGNFVSDLGRKVSVSGEANSAASVVFTISTSLFAICLLPHFLFVPMQAWDRPSQMIGVAVIGSLASLALVYAAFHPADLYPAKHHIGLFLWVMLLFAATGLHAMALLTSKDNVWLPMPLLSVAVAMLAIGYSIHAADTSAAYILFREHVPLKSALLEKLLFVATLVWLFAFSIQMMANADFSEYQEKDRDRDAARFIAETGMRRR